VTDAVLLNARNNCKIAMCGSISEYDNKEWYRFIACVTYKHTHKRTYKKTYIYTYIHECYVHDTCVNCVHIHISREHLQHDVNLHAQSQSAYMHECILFWMTNCVFVIYECRAGQKKWNMILMRRISIKVRCVGVYIFNSVDIFGYTHTQANTCLHTHTNQKHTYTHAHSCTHTHA